MLYAKFMYPNYGYEYDKQKAKNAGLKVGEKYKVKKLSMGQSATSIELEGYAGAFNSVQFQFEKDGETLDVYRDPKYNPYLPGKL